MFQEAGSSERDLFTTVFSDDPLPDVEAAIIVAHPGDEAVGASWVMARLQERASVYCLSRAGHGCPGGLSREVMAAVDPAAARAATAACAALAGVPHERCHNLGLAESELARDLEALVWLTTATVSAVKPRVLVTHAYEGRNLDHDATCFAVHVAAKLMSRYGAAAPLLVEFPRHGDPPSAPADSLVPLTTRPAVRIEFGPESRKVKRRMLQCHGDAATAIDSGSLQSEAYVMAGAGDLFDGLMEIDGVYLDAPWCGIDEFRQQARSVYASFTRAVLSSPAQA